MLSIETSTTNCSVAVGKDGNLLAMEESGEKDYSHAEKLHLFISEVLKKAKVSLKDLDAIAVGKGPGSYTGLRIGVSAAKGLCYSLNVSLISINSLFALAKQVSSGKNEFTVPMIDARRMEVYSAIFDPTGKQLRETRAEILTETSFLEYLGQGKVYFIGDGTEKFQRVQTHPNAVFLKENLPSSREMIPAAEKKFTQNDFEDTAYFEPFYLKDFVGGK